MSPQECETLFHKALSHTSTLGVGKMVQVALAVGVNVSDIPDRERRPPIIDAISRKFNQQDISGKIQAVRDIANATLRYALEPETKRELETIKKLASSDEYSVAETNVPILDLLPRKQALKDEITVLLAAESRSPVSVIFIDLDGFKAVNDTFGHAAGDQCLNAFVRETQAVIAGKGILYRSGEGDEFCVLLKNFSSGESAETAERLRKAIETANLGGETKVTCSIGVACSDVAELSTADVLINAADTAMYVVKNSTKNRVCLYPPSAQERHLAEANKRKLALNQATPKEAFKARITTFIARFEVEWESERRLNPRTMDVARDTLRNACSKLLDFYVEAQQLYPDEPLVLQLLKRAEQEARTLIQVMPEKERDVQNEGFRFWEHGNDIMQLLKKTPF